MRESSIIIINHNHDYLTKTKVTVNSILNRGIANQWIPNIATRRLYSTMNDHRPMTNQRKSMMSTDYDDVDDDQVEVGGVVYTMKGISNNTDIQTLVKALSKLAVSSNAPLKGKILIFMIAVVIVDYHDDENNDDDETDGLILYFICIKIKWKQHFNPYEARRLTHIGEIS
jgi:hypothetical protein